MLALVFNKTNNYLLTLMTTDGGSCSRMTTGMGREKEAKQLGLGDQQKNHQIISLTTCN